MSTRSCTIKSFAKINLDLRVPHKRPDGFHELRTVFQTISLADIIEIQFEKSRKTQLAIDDPLAIPDNLILRAAREVLDACKTHARVHFRLTKNIPMGGGLGGGSSNAASILLALPVLAGKPLELERLESIAAGLGSDVPFFLHGGTALGIGRGTELYPLPDIRPEPVLIVSPGVHVSTPEAYRALARSLTETSPSSKIKTFPSFVQGLGQLRSLGKAIGASHNDFEQVVFARHPEIKAVHRRLLRLGAAGARMTGSGSAVFAVFDSRKQRDDATNALARERYCVLPAALVGRRAYRALWRRQLGPFLGNADRWPPQSQYAR